MGDRETLASVVALLICALLLCRDHFRVQLTRRLQLPHVSTVVTNDPNNWFRSALSLLFNVGYVFGTMERRSARQTHLCSALYSSSLGLWCGEARECAAQQRSISAPNSTRLLRSALDTDRRLDAKFQVDSAYFGMEIAIDSSPSSKFIKIDKDRVVSLHKWLVDALKVPYRG